MIFRKSGGSFRGRYVFINFLKQSLPVKLNARVHFTSEAGDLLMSQNAMGIFQFGVKRFQVMDGLKQGLILGFRVGVKISVPVHQFHTNGRMIKGFPGFCGIFRIDPSAFSGVEGTVAHSLPTGNQFKNLSFSVNNQMAGYGEDCLREKYSVFPLDSVPYSEELEIPRKWGWNQSEGIYAPVEE